MSTSTADAIIVDDDGPDCEPPSYSSTPSSEPGLQKPNANTRSSSPAWDLFTHHEETNISNCHKCSYTLHCRKRDGLTSQLFSHLRSKHNITKEMILKKREQNEILAGRLQRNLDQLVSNHNKKKITASYDRINNNLIKFVVSTNSSFSSLKDKYLQAALAENPIYTNKHRMLSTTTISNNIKDLAINYLNGCIAYICQNQVPVCLTTDGWSYRGFGFEVINMCFYYCEKITTVILALTPVEGSSTIELYTFLKNQITENKLEKLICGITSDNASNISGALQRLTNDADFPRLDPNKNAVGCLLHIINLSTKSIIQNLSSNTIDFNIVQSSNDNDNNDAGNYDTGNDASAVGVFPENENLLGNEFSTTNGTFESNLMRINNILNDAQPSDLLNLLKRINQLVALLSRSNVERARYEKCLKSYRSAMGKINYIKGYVATRWNSCVASLEALLSNKELLLELYEKTGNDKYKFDGNDFNSCTKLIVLMKDAENITHTLSSNVCHLGYFLPVLEWLILQLFKSREQAEGENDYQLSNAIESGINKLKDYYRKFNKNPIFITAAYFSKIKGLPFQIDEEQKTIMCEYLNTYHNSMKLSDHSTESSNRGNLMSNNQGNSEKCAKLDLWRSKFETESLLREKNDFPKMTFQEFLSINEVSPEIMNENYVPAAGIDDASEAYCSEVKELIFNFCKSNKIMNIFESPKDKQSHYTRLVFEDIGFKTKFPILSVKLQEIFTIRPTSIISERTFSMARHNATFNRMAGFRKDSEHQGFTSCIKLKSFLTADLSFSSPFYHDTVLP